ncbi:hypothetical protein F5X96DRAFT_681739 [Biscogniauxia mediterranea]|nr:hypothetical protein F5X96DRAFT_681739 [Biscogniauxia mediterranea]
MPFPSLLDKISPPPYSITPYQVRVEDGEGATKPDDEKKAHRDLYGLLGEYAPKNEKTGKLWAEVNTTPNWVDWGQIERGQKVFYRYGGAIITTLTFVSLLGGMGSGRTVETLDRTGDFGVTVVRRRLLETAQHILNATRDLESIKPGGDGFVNSVQVRLLHAAVRRCIMQMAELRPEYYDMGRYGVPINDLNSLGTISTFSAAVRMMESLLVSEIRPTRTSATLANNIITGLQGQAPTYASREFMCAETNWLNGRELSRALVLGQCMLFMAMGYLNRSVPCLDERNINVS